MGFNKALQLHLPHRSSYSLDLNNFFVNLLIFHGNDSDVRIGSLKNIKKIKLDMLAKYF